MATYQSLEPVPEIIETERLMLRPYQAGDGAMFLEAIEETRDELERWLSWPARMTSLDAAEDYCRRCRANWIRRDDLTYALFLRETGAYLGSTGLHDPNWDDRRFEIGYFLRASAQGKGFATEAVRAIAAMALNELAANRVAIWCDTRNLPSIQVAERAGFTLEGTLRNWESSPDGTLRDYRVFSLTSTPKGGA